MLILSIKDKQKHQYYIQPISFKIRNKIIYMIFIGYKVLETIQLIDVIILANDTDTFISNATYVYHRFIKQIFLLFKFLI